VEAAKRDTPLNRTLFYDAVKQEFGSYLKELNDQPSTNFEKN